MTTHDAAVAIADALFGPAHPAHADLVTYLDDHPAAVALAAGDVDTDTAVRAVVDAACAALRARAAVIADHATDRAA